MTAFGRIKTVWIIVLFDLPSDTKQARQQYTRFRKSLLINSFSMMQYSVYIRHCASKEKFTSGWRSENSQNHGQTVWENRSVLREKTSRHRKSTTSTRVFVIKYYYFTLIINKLCVMECTRPRVICNSQRGL